MRYGEFIVHTSRLANGGSSRRSATEVSSTRSPT